MPGLLGTFEQAGSMLEDPLAGFLAQGSPRFDPALALPNPLEKYGINTENAMEDNVWSEGVGLARVGSCIM